MKNYNLVFDFGNDYQGNSVFQEEIKNHKDQKQCQKYPE